VTRVRYHPDQAREPYLSTGRHGKPKEDFRTLVAALRQRLDVAAAVRLADIGCANGELLHYLRREFPHWDLSGFDITEAFIATARRVPGLEGVRLHQRDLFEIDDVFDVVVSTCFLSLFADVLPPLERMLELCRPGGWVLGTGLFNPADIEVRVEFCDNTHPRTRGVWRSDFNRPSQAAIRRALEGRVRSIAFEPCSYEVLNLAPDLDNPIRVWTMRDEGGRTWLVNGAQQICNQVLLIVQK
jgi:SAM-dependent methyltransferase